MASEWQSVMGAVAKQALGAKAMRALSKTKRNTRRRKAASSSRNVAKGADRHEQILKNYVESLELTNPGDGFEADDDDDDSDAEDFEENESDSDDDVGGSSGGRKKKKPPRKRARRKKKVSPKAPGAQAKKKVHKQRFKSLAQVLTDQYTSGDFDPSDEQYPHYLSVAASSDNLPPRQFCYVTGQPAKYRDGATGEFGAVACLPADCQTENYVQRECCDCLRLSLAWACCVCRATL